MRPLLALPRRVHGWFTAPDSPVPLAWFRIGVALFCLAKLWAIRGSLLDVYGQYGYVQWVITRYNLYAGLPHLGDLVVLLQRTGLTADQGVLLVVGVQASALVALLVGWHTRLASVVAWSLNFLLIHAAGGVMYGMEIFTHIALLFGMAMPWGDALSLDVRQGRRRAAPSVAAGVTRRLLQLQMCLVYLSAGFEKLAGAQWRDGEAIWRAMNMPAFQQVDMTWLAQAPWLAVALCWATIVTEGGYAFCVWSRRTRALWVAGTVGMHLFIGLFLGMWFFAAIMILLNLGAFGAECVADLRALWPARRWRGLQLRPARVPARVLARSR